MGFYNKKGIYIIISLFMAWVLIASFWYVCGIKGFCQRVVTEEKTEEVGKIEEIHIEDSFQQKSRIVIECSTYLKEDLNKIEIQKLQSFLNKFEDANLDVDGVYGLFTQKAIENFQEKNQDSISKVDGRVGEETRYQINKDYCIYEFKRIKK